MTTELHVSTNELRLMVTALEHYRSHLVGYLLPQALEDRDEYAAETALLQDQRAESLLRHIESVGLILNNGEV